MGYMLLKVLHILFAIVAVGFSTSFGIIMATAAGNLDATRFSLRLIQRLERIMRVGFIGLILSGLALGVMGEVSWHALWFTGSLAISLVAFTIGLTVAVPTLKAQIALVEQPAPPMDELKRMAGRSRAVGMTLGMASLLVLFFMVLKPM
jgi:magnesium-transporting ATPase (P-type)